ncbi:MAG TPA: cyclic nucleotide-binding domain-containing protein [Candidatus Methylacidiphilales bacterium]
MKEIPFAADQEDSIVRTLRQVSFFSHLADRHILDIFRLSRLRQFDSGEVLIPEGVYDSFIYVLVTGEVEIRKNDNAIARLHRTGDLFGELAVISYEPRSASVVAMAKTSCLAIDAAFLDNLVPHDRDAIYAVVYKMFAEIVADRLRNTSNELAALREENFELRLKLSKYQR